ncbi:MAG: hypothetical protein ACRDBP_18260 [Luteolibacter sp.]
MRTTFALLLAMAGMLSARLDGQREAVGLVLPAREFLKSVTRKSSARTPGV